MTKKLGMSVADWVFNDIIENRSAKISRSEWVEQLIIAGYNSIKKSKDSIQNDLEK